MARLLADQEASRQTISRSSWRRARAADIRLSSAWMRPAPAGSDKAGGFLSPDLPIREYEGDPAEIAALEALHLDDGSESFQPSNLEITAVESSSKATNVIPGAAVEGVGAFAEPERDRMLVPLDDRRAPATRHRHRHAPGHVPPPAGIAEIIGDRGERVVHALLLEPRRRRGSRARCAPR